MGKRSTRAIGLWALAILACTLVWLTFAGLLERQDWIQAGRTPTQESPHPPAGAPPGPSEAPSSIRKAIGPEDPWASQPENPWAEAKARPILLQVVVKGTGQPIPGVVVTVEPHGHDPTAPPRGPWDRRLCLVTDPEGKVTFSSVNLPSPHWVQVSHPRYTPLVKRTPVRPGPERHTLHMRPPPSVEGLVLDPQGRPLPGAEITLVFPDRDLRGKVTSLAIRTLGLSNDQGAFSRDLRRAPPSDACLVANRDNLLSHAVPVANLTPLGGTWRVRFQLQRGATLHGQVVDPRDQPVAGCRIHLHQTPHPHYPSWTFHRGPVRWAARLGLTARHVTTDTDGRFRSAGWPEGAQVELFIFNSEKHEIRLQSVTPGTPLGERQAVTTLQDSTPLRLQVVLQTKKSTLFHGRVRGFTAQERARIRISFMTGRAGYRLRPTWDGDRFTAKLTIDARGSRSPSPFYVIIKLPGTSHQSRTGPFYLGADREIKDLEMIKGKKR